EAFDEREVIYNGWSIDKVLALPLPELLKIFTTHEALVQKLHTAIAFGLQTVSLDVEVSDLSIEETKRLLLAAACHAAVRGENLLICDQPFSGLEECEVELGVQRIAGLASGRLGFVYSSHQRAALLGADWLIVLSREAEILYQGEPEIG